MKTLVRTIIGYSFDELDEIARKVAKSNVVLKEREPMFFSEDLIETLIEDFGLHHLKTYFSLSYSQGDGLCLYGKIYFEELFDNMKFKKIAFKGIHHKQIQSIYDELQGIDFEHRGRYFHEKSVYIESQEYNPTDKQMAIIDKVVENVKAWYFSFCKEWEKRGYEYFYEISDDEMEMICSEYDYLFTENGELIDNSEYSIAV